MAFAAPASTQVRAGVLQCNFTLKNTGKTVETDPALHRMNANAWLTLDVYRLAVSVEGKGWSARLLNELAAVKFGESQPVAVYLSRAPGAASTARVTLKATSESDPTKTATATIEQKAR